MVATIDRQLQAEAAWPLPRHRAGSGGNWKAAPEDFLVEEIPVREADGIEGKFLLLKIQKRSLDSQEAMKLLASHLDLPLRDLGMAGRKDRHSISTQFLSLPWAARRRLDSFEHADLQLLDSQPHSRKLRRGDLRANQFCIRLRNLRCTPDEAAVLAAERLARLGESGGLENFYGPQRFGNGLSSLRRGLQAAGSGTVHGRDVFAVSSLQSALFNLILDRRRQEDSLRRPMLGDLMLDAEEQWFVSSDPAVEEGQCRSGQLRLTGPLWGSQMRRPPESSPASEREAAVLGAAGLQLSDLPSWGKLVPGSRRPFLVPVEEASAVALGGEGALELRFRLPAGSFASRLVAEIVGELPIRALPRSNAPSQDLRHD